MLRLVMSPRWIMWHVLTIGAMLTCGLLAAWQWGRAGSAMGSALNVGYGLQWPVFAVFFGVMWWRMLRLEIRGLEAAGLEAAGLEAVSPTAVEPVVRRAVIEGPSPFGPRPVAVAGSARADQDDPELAEYNRMLGQLAARDR